jgi:hypothetical protein
MLRHLIAPAILLVLTAMPCARAQAPPPGTRVELRLLAFGPPPGADALFAHDPAAKDDAVGTAVQLKTYLNHESYMLTLHGQEVVFTTRAERASLRQANAQMARLTLPAGKRELILLFLPREQDGRSIWQAMAIDGSARGFPPGSLQILNLSASTVRIQLETTTFDFKSGETKVIGNPPVGPNQHSAMTALAFTSGEWRRIGAGLWPHPGRKRSVQVLFDDPASGQVELRGFRDVVEPGPG